MSKRHAAHEPIPRGAGEAALAVLRTWPFRRLTLPVLGSIALLHAALAADYTVDDAYITFRYSRNLARGAGAVFNPGEYVKGYSNTLYMWLMALPELFHRDPIAFSKGVGIASYLALVWLLHRQSEREFGPVLGALGAPAFALLSMPLSVWYMAGLETGSYTTCIVAAVLSRLREQEDRSRPWSSVFFSAAVLLRPEGVIFFVTMLAHEVAFRLLTRRRPALHDLAFFVLPPLVYASELLVSKAYYGAYFPSTFHAKVAHSDNVFGDLGTLVEHVADEWTRADSYTRGGLATAGGWIVLALAVPAFLDRRRLRLAFAFALMVLAQVAFIARAQGDWMPAYRFCVPLLPFVYLLATLGLGRVAETLPRAREPLTALSCAAYLGFLAWTTPQLLHARAARVVAAEPFLRQGATFANLLPPGAMLASFDVGGLSYAGDLDVLDTAGLTDDVFARCRKRGRACQGYAALLEPEWVRRHPGKKKADFVYKELLRTSRYLELASQRFLVERELVLVRTPPPWARGLSPAPDVPAAVVATELPEHAAPSAEMRGVLYWRARPEARASVVPRKVSWGRGAAKADARASEVLWQSFPPVDAWDAESIFADRFAFLAPSRPGRYELSVQTSDGRSQSLGALEVVRGARAREVVATLLRRARELAQRHEPEAAAARLREALWTAADGEVRRAYDELSVQNAQALLAEARRSGDPDALRQALRRARQWLHRAYWESGRASKSLRRAIDDVGRRQRDLVRAALAGRDASD